MWKKIFEFNSQKGAAVIELLAVLTTATLVIGNVAFKPSDFLSNANDAQKIANVRQMVNAMEIYYLDHNAYPAVEGQNRFDNLISQLGGYLNSLPTNTEKYDYKDFNSGQDYVIKVTLENQDNPILKTGLTGQIQGIDCHPPTYCLKI